MRRSTKYTLWSGALIACAWGTFPNAIGLVFIVPAAMLLLMSFARARAESRVPDLEFEAAHRTYHRKQGWSDEDIDGTLSRRRASRGQDPF